MDSFKTFTESRFKDPSKTAGARKSATNRQKDAVSKYMKLAREAKAKGDMKAYEKYRAKSKALVSKMMG